MSYVRLLQKEDHEIDLYRFEKQGMWGFLFFVEYSNILYSFYNSLCISSVLYTLSTGTNSSNFFNHQKNWWDTLNTYLYKRSEKSRLC